MTRTEEPSASVVSLNRPIEIQRKIGVRALQNELQLPPFLARPLGKIMRSGLPITPGVPRFCDVEHASCLLIEGHRLGS